MAEAKLKVLESRREYLFRCVQILYDTSKELDKDPSKIISFRSRFKTIDTVRTEFHSINEEIQEILLQIKPDAKLDHNALLTFDDLYYFVISVNDRITEQNRERERAKHDEDGEPRSDSSSKQYNARLPKIELPKFDSNIENWQTFYDTFKNLIHENKTLSSVEKFHYLISCLSGSALTIAKGVPLTGDNYQHVFDTLIERYENKRLLVVTYIEKIQNFPQIKNSNFADLQRLYNTLYESFNALNSLNVKNLGDFILFHAASRALDADTRKRFEIQNESQIPTFQELLEFLQDYVKVLEATQQSSYNSNAPPRSSPPLSKHGKASESRPPSGGGQRRFVLTTQNTNVSPPFRIDCLCCGAAHSVYKCPTYQSMNVKARLAFVAEKKMCINCLRKNHTVVQCMSKSCCQVCGLRHHTTLHAEKSFDNTSKPPPEPSPENNSNTTSTSSQAHTSVHVGRSRDSSLVLLGTCTVCVYDVFGTPHHLRALIDSGSQDCFITSACAATLGLPLRRCRLNVAGIGENVVTRVKGITKCTIQPCDISNPKFNIQPIVMDKITTQMPLIELPSVVKERYKHLVLADRNFDKPSDIHLLLGAELFHDIYDGQRIHLEPGLPAALHSVFGWVLTGPLDVAKYSPPSTVSSLFASTIALDDVVKQFWEVEEPPQTRLCSPEDEECERLYTDLTYREPDGRYVVPLLLKDPNAELGKSYDASLSQLLHLEKRLNRHEQLKDEYTAFMHEYECLGHMQKTKGDPTHGKYFIPHHCVIRPESTTTRLRVVFNASSPTSNKLSLNDLVHTGPKLQADIVDIITGFRLHKVVFTCDISKMYRQILIRPEDRAWQHILWRDSQADSVQNFELRTVTYGVTSSPYLAIRTLHQLADDHGSQWPHAAEALRHHTFMDDITTGSSCLTSALKLKDDLISLLSCAQLELRKWTSNCAQFLNQLPVEHCQSPKTFSEQDSRSILKILGVQWEPQADYFTYSVANVDIEYTKRSILSNVARIFDPLGWVTPYVLTAKLLLQNLWRLQLGWDEEIPRDLSKDWKVFVTDLENLQHIKIARQAILTDATEVKLIGFCDGSTKAYGCCVYLRSVTNGVVQTSLLIAKSKVAPLKPLTVNRLELCGAALLARVLKHMVTLLSPKLNVTQVIAFTDSSTVLSWLNTEPHKLKTFVAHRVVKITDSIHQSQWKHVSTHDNPADYCSRGLSCSELAACDQWWSGPHWLRSDPTQWPVNSEVERTEELPELKSTSLLSHSAESGNVEVLPMLLDRFSSLSRLQRVLAWCFRFIHNARVAVLNKRETQINGSLTWSELDQSLKTLIKHVQTSAFDVSSIHTRKGLPKSLLKLSSFVDPQGFMRVGGRLENSNLPEHAKHPYILPKKSPLSRMIVDFYHKKYLHCGPRTLQSLVQRQYWILGIRNLIRSRLAKCVTCFKVKPVSCQPIMGDLPSLRVEPGSCFQNVGIDFGGPFTVKESRRRNAKTYKAYICLFVCLSVKAIHLELVTELSTEAFIAALDRFVARRGLCHTVISDRGTNFVGAKRYLSEITELFVTENESISEQLAARGITWKLNPASAPHFGGIFESGIKSTKYHLKRVIGLQVLTFEEFYTLLTKVEAMLNSRPLCDLSSDPHELNVLTAGHFIIGRPLVSLPETRFDDQNINLRSRWQMLQRLSQIFWRIWQRDYLHTLQQKTKWYSDGKMIPSVGDVVMINDPNLPPTEWRLGRIIQTHPGKDNIIRVVTIKTTKGSLVRPIVKICPLPNNSNSN